MTEPATGVGIRVPTPVSVDEWRRHMRFMHAVFLEASLPLDGEHGIHAAHDAAHSCARDIHTMTVEQLAALPRHRSAQCWHDDIPHWHTPPEPPPPPEPDRVWW